MEGKVSEVFKSIQGEGIYRGVLQVFIRFFGCNLNCKFCDTQLNYYRRRSIESLLAEINSYHNYHSLSLTGGEPLLQITFLKQLVKALKREGKILYLETNGTLYQNLREVIDYIDIISMDFKLPSSTRLKSFWKEHREFLKIALEKQVFIKAIIGKTTLVDDLQQTIELIRDLKDDLNFILQPQNPFEHLLEEKIDYFRQMCENYNIRVKTISQLHKKIAVK